MVKDFFSELEWVDVTNATDAELAEMNRRLEERQIERERQRREEQQAEWHRQDWMNFILKCKYMEDVFPEYSSRDFYRFLFPEGSFQKAGDLKNSKGNGVIMCLGEERKGKEEEYSYVVLDDHKYISKQLGRKHPVMSPMSYWGHRPLGTKAHELFAFAIDIDYVSATQLDNLFRHINANLHPQPTFVCVSGAGVHVWYVFDEPIPMFKNVKEPLKNLKDALTDRLVNQYTSDFEVRNKGKKDFLPLTQGMRLVGAHTKFEDHPEARTRAFQTGERVSLNYLNQFVPEWARVEDIIYEPTTMPIDEAKEKYPEWYERVIVQGKKSKRWQWDIDDDLYEWWLRRIKQEAFCGNRYFCVMCLAIYAVKCNIGRDRLEKDVQEVFDLYNSWAPKDDPFREIDRQAAMNAYKKRYNTFPRKDIAKLTRLEMPENNRNYQDRWTHLQADVWVVGGKRKANICKQNRLLNQGGRPKGSTKGITPKGNEVRAYAAEHPDATQREIAAALGVSKTTVNKWLKDL